MLVQLVMFRSDGQRREFTLRKNVTLIGRATECDFQIPLPMVSRMHCEITVREDHISIRDKGSSNGTYVNGQRVQEADLERGDKLVIGPITFTIVVDGQPATIDVVPSTGSARGPQELDGGTVDVDAAMEQQLVSGVKQPAKAPARPVPAKAPVLAPMAPPTENEIEHLEEVEEVVELDSLDSPTQETPLSELQAITRPKNGSS